MKKIIWMLLACLLAFPALAETVQDQALAFLNDAGVGADSVSRVGDDIVVMLPSGGTAVLHLPGDFDPYGLSWRFENASDEEVAAYLEHALTLLAALEAKLPAEVNGLTDGELRRAQVYAAMIENALLGLENTGMQGLLILQEALAAQADSPLDSLRARLAVRLQEAAEASLPGGG